MRKYIIFGVTFAVVLFLLFMVFGSGITISINPSPTSIPTLTHEQELVAPFETTKAELKKLRP